MLNKITSTCPQSPSHQFQRFGNSFRARGNLQWISSEANQADPTEVRVTGAIWESESHRLQSLLCRERCSSCQGCNRECVWKLIYIQRRQADLSLRSFPLLPKASGPWSLMTVVCSPAARCNTTPPHKSSSSRSPYHRIQNKTCLPGNIKGNTYMT